MCYAFDADSAEEDTPRAGAPAAANTRMYSPPLKSPTGLPTTFCSQPERLHLALVQVRKRRPQHVVRSHYSHVYYYASPQL